MAKSQSAESADLATYKAISKSRLTSILNTVRASQAVITEETASIGGTISDAVDNHRLHKGAFSVIRKLDKMAKKKEGTGEASVCEFLFHLDAMIDMLGFREMNGLPLEDRGKDEEDEEDDEDESESDRLHA
jgi:hypothetical protein